MALQRFKVLILIVTAVLALFIASPVLEQLIVMSQTQLTEMWLLGPKHDATYPSAVNSSQQVRLYLDVSNHLGSYASYVAEVKFRNATQSAPDSFAQTSSKLPALARLTFFVADNATYELPIDVTFTYNVTEGTTRQLQMQTVTINGEAISVNSTRIAFDSAKGGFYGNLFFELYLYNSAGGFEYHQRYVSLWLQMLP
jgi:uncharacterized membrane protein